MVEELSKRLNILFWRPDYYGALVDGGLSSTLNGIVVELIKLNHEIFFISGGKLNFPTPSKQFHIPFSKFLRNFPEIFAIHYHYKSTKRTKKLLKSLPKIDFLYQNCHDFNFSGSLIKQHFGIPFFLHADGVQFWIKQNWGKLYFSKLLRWAEEIQWVCCDRIFTVSNNLKKHLIQFGAEENKIVVNPNGFDPEVFNPNIDSSSLKRQLGIENKFVIGFSGTFGYYHGIAFLAKAIKQTVMRIPNAVFIFIGDGEYRPQLEEIVKQDNVEKNVLITGFVPFAKVPKYLALCNVLVSPCINNDDGTEFFNSPIKNFEYMGMRKPIVATAIGQQKEIFMHEVNAMLVEERNPEAIANAIIELYENPDLAQNIAENAYHDGISHHTWKHRAMKLLETYHQLKNK